MAKLAKQMAIMEARLDEHENLIKSHSATFDTIKNKFAADEVLINTNKKSITTIHDQIDAINQRC